MDPTDIGCVFLALLSAAWHRGSTAASYNCDDPLASPLPAPAFDSSSELFGSRGDAKLNSREGAGGWTPLESNTRQWLQIDLGERFDITGVATQGRYGSSDWVMSYSLMFSDTGRNWRPYHQDNNIWAFAGNTNADGVVQHKFQHSIKARFLRFVPTEWNLVGRIGMRVEVYGCPYKSDVVDFDGRSSLQYRFNQKQMTTFKDVISLKFKSMQSDGVLFHGEGQRGDYITLELQKGKLSLYINLGDTKLRFGNTHTVVTLGSLLDDQQWHSVLIDRFNKQVNFTVDKHTQHFRTKGDSDNLDIDYEFSFGGIPVPGKPGTFLKRNFHGCIENLYYNGVNIIDLAKRRKPQIFIVGNVTFSCSEPHVIPVTFTNSSTSYLLLPGTPQMDGFSVSFEFRTWNGNGLLLTTQFSGGSGVLLLQLVSGKLLLEIQEGEHILTLSSGSGLNDGLWHAVTINARRHRLTLTLDNAGSSPDHLAVSAAVFSGSRYYFGGCPDHLTDSHCIHPVPSFQGCMRLLFIDNQPKDLISVQRGLIGNYSEVQIDTCGIRDRCLPNYCQHGGECSQSWNAFYCDCGATGYGEATCHSSLYQDSCEALRHRGFASDYYHIDPDGSGPLGPLRVFCNITEDKIWTLVPHNNTELTPVHGNFGVRPYAMLFNYNSTMEQLEAMINRAEYCEQEVAYHCKHSRLLNSPNGAPFTWWIGRGTERHTYWGGSLPGVQKCACGLEESCIDMRHFCNCDADKHEWTNDTGFLNFKDHLPVSQIVITDANRTGSEAAWRIGPLRCYGDRSFWNAVSFNTASSFLPFPIFHPEFSADVSFFFKTTSASGVFLENLGVKDFMRIELISPYQVIFSFDAGSGPTEVLLHSVSALNDGQWHYVKAERNMKEATLIVDNQPKRLAREALDGRIRLPLSSQLYVGGTLSNRQRGFVGCIRSLQFNGQMIDLKERARLTPDIRPGCPGHCGTYGHLCRNNGKCVEKRNGYFCDCTNSAYEGPSCVKEVSAMFEAGTSVTYIFQEPYPVSKNASNFPSSPIYADTVISKENISFSFVTGQAPSLLLHINSFYHDYLAVLLIKNGSLQVRYKVSKEGTQVFTLESERLDNRRPHHVRISREGRELIIQIDKMIKQRHNFSSDIYFKAIKSLTLGKVVDNPGLDSEVAKANTFGFVGCLSSVQYNHVAPLKAALRHPSIAPVTVTGTLSECSCGSVTESDLSTVTTTYSSSGPFGKDDDREPITNAVRSDSAVIGGVIAVTVFIIFCIVAIMTKILYQHKETHRKNQKKEKEYPSSMENSFRNEMDLQNAVSECKKEYFI
ncbi:contactin-associated protein-like 5 [Xenopus tropicalis]|uniref:Contactin-associated protein-like 5 n=5 Tax=Xenopus tropicalis TaxID=8364 RepID=A0A8J1IX08_XENTR|nr:contactin-associated protein-like 5 [Xenopus tropicalis]